MDEGKIEIKKSLLISLLEEKDLQDLFHDMQREKSHRNKLLRSCMRALTKNRYNLYMKVISFYVFLFYTFYLSHFLIISIL